MAGANNSERVQQMLNKYKKVIDKKQRFNKEEYEKITFKLKKEQQTIRVLFYPDTLEPFVEIKQHFNVLGKTYFCPTNDGEKCPFCELARKLYDEANKDTVSKSDKETLRKMAGKLNAKTRYYSPLIVRNPSKPEEELTVKYWNFGAETQKDIIRLFVDPDVGIIFDAEYGRDLKVTGEDAKLNGRDYLKAAILPSMRQTPLFENEDQRKVVIDSVKSPIELFGLRQDKSYADLLKICKDWEDSGFAEKAPSNEQKDESDTQDEDTSVSQSVGDSEHSTSEEPTTHDEKVDSGVKTDTVSTNDAVRARLEAIRNQVNQSAKG